MSKDKLTDYDATAGNNTDIGGISVDEGMLPSNVNNAIREMMSHLKDFAAGTEAVTNVKSDTVTADTLAEKTTDNGVTVDGLLIKDKEIGTSAAPATLQASSLNDGQFGRRNLIINGAMNVAQRGTSEAGVGAVTNYANAPDRVKYVSLNSAGTHEYTISQSTTSPNGFGNSYKLDCTTADTSLASDVAVFLSVSPMEGQNLQHLQYGTSGAKSVTLSFHVRSNKTGTYVIELYSPDTNKHIAKTYTINSADTWEKKTLTFVGDTASALDNDNARSLEVLVWLGAGSNYNSGTLPATWGTLVNANRCVGQTVNLADNTANELFITGVQLEVGSVATEFEHRSFGEELVLCKRYFQKYTFGNNKPVVNVASWNGAAVFGAFPFEVEMRAIPTLGP